jgi:hypothetical protein
MAESSAMGAKRSKVKQPKDVEYVTRKGQVKMVTAKHAAAYRAKAGTRPDTSGPAAQNWKRELQGAIQRQNEFKISELGYRPYVSKSGKQKVAPPRYGRRGAAEALARAQGVPLPEF